MLTVWNHEGEIPYEIDGETMGYRGSEIFVTAKAAIVFGRTAEGLEWEVDRVNLVYATDEDGEDLKLSAEEEKELEAQIAFELLANPDIDEKVHLVHEEIVYWERRR